MLVGVSVLPVRVAPGFGLIAEELLQLGLFVSEFDREVVILARSHQPLQRLKIGVFMPVAVGGHDIVLGGDGFEQFF